MSRHRRAVAAYVRGHDRVWEVERMRGSSPPAPAAIEWGGEPAPPSFGVGVAHDLRFERGPGNARAQRADGEPPRDDD